MSALELTYDSRQDRVLLKTGLSISQPDWWITRRSTLTLIQQLSASSHAQFETQALLSRLTSDDDESLEHVDDYDEYEQETSEQSQTTLTKSKDLIADSEQFPLAIQCGVDFADNGLTQITFISSDRSGTAMELPDDAVIRFKQMLEQLVDKANW